MRRPLRWLWNGLTVLSLLLFVATAVLWVRSYHHQDILLWQINRWENGDGNFRAYGIDSDSGGVVLVWFRRSVHDDPRGLFYGSNPPLSEPIYVQNEPLGYPLYDGLFPGASIWGFGYFHGSPYSPDMLTHNDRFVLLPDWFVILLTAWLPAHSLRSRLRRPNGSGGRCLACGYDLRASPDRCPECGKMAQAKVKM